MDNENLLQLEGVVENIVYRNEENGYTVIEISDGDDYITAVGIMPQANVGDYVLVHAGFAIEVVDADYAKETIELVKQLEDVAV